MLQLIPGQHIHIVGIGGAGMSAIAHILLEQGFFVSGSDMSTNTAIELLRSKGADIYQGHDIAHIQGAEIIVVSSAIPTDNEEVMAGLAQGIQIYKRADILPIIMEGFDGVAVAGTHGKTTTTSMITHILIEAEKDPSYVIGGKLALTDKTAALGNGKIFVIEADEYDNMFHGLRPHVQVITNVEYDHPDFFESPNTLVESFSYFIGLLPEDGLLVVCADDPTAMIFAYNREIVHLPTATYGIKHPKAQWQAHNIDYRPSTTHFDVHYKEEKQGAINLHVPGEYNVQNALAAIAVATHFGVTFDEIAKALDTFKGTSRRFDLRAEVNDIAIVDDYAHHPTAIKATIRAAQQHYPNHQIWAVWQPHTYSRTKQFMGEYALAFADADHVIVTDIFPAREKPIPDVSLDALRENIKHPNVYFAELHADAVAVLKDHVASPAVVLIMCAGDAQQIGIDYLALLQEPSS